MTRLATVPFGRIRAELVAIQTDPLMNELGASIVVSKESRQIVDVCIDGPEGSPYEGGRFEFSILCPPDYPFKKPKIRFATEIWHPRISEKGYLTLEPISAWTPLMSIGAVIVEVYKCLEHRFDGTVYRRVGTNLSRGFTVGVGNSDAWNQFRSDIDQFKEKARQMTLKYAQP